MLPSDESDSTVNPYAAPRSAFTTSPTVEHPDVQAEELTAFVGARADYYLERWTPLLKGWGRSTGFNWAAFFLSGLWLPYRKMYKVTAVFYAIILLESLAEDILFIHVLGKPETPAAVDRLVGLAAWIICGAFGNGWYLAHARKVISEVASEGLTHEARLQMISRRGGTSLVSSLGFFFAFLFFMVAAFVALDFVLYPT